MSDGQLERSQFPALAISDLIVLTMALAAAMAFAAPGIQDQTRMSWRDTSRELSDFSAIGLSLFGLIVLARQRIRGAVWQLEPGHWLLIAVGPYSIALLFVISFQDYTQWYPLLRLWPDVLLVVTVGASSVISVTGVRRVSRAWKACLVAVVCWLVSVIVYCVSDAGALEGFWRRSSAVVRYSTLLGTNPLAIAGLAALAAITTDLVANVR